MWWILIETQVVLSRRHLYSVPSAYIKYKEEHFSFLCPGFLLLDLLPLFYLSHLYAKVKREKYQVNRRVERKGTSRPTSGCEVVLKHSETAAERGTGKSAWVLLLSTSSSITSLSLASRTAIRVHRFFLERNHKYEEKTFSKSSSLQDSSLHQSKDVARKWNKKSFWDLSREIDKRIILSRKKLLPRVR